MDKSKKAAYLEKFQKWKTERNGKENQTRGPPEKKVKTSVHVAKAVVKPKVPTTSEIDRPKVVTSVSRTSLVNRKNVLQTAKVTKPKVLEKRKSHEEELMSTKLNKWKQKKITSEQKFSTTKPKTAAPANTPAAATHKYKEVKSRLFDFQSKPKLLRYHDKTAIDRPIKDYKITNQQPAKRNNAKKVHSVPSVQAPVVKSAIKRRHSEVSHSQRQVKKKPASILKRKSCVGSFDFTQEEKLEQKPTNVCPAKREALSDELEEMHVSDDVFTLETDCRRTVPVNAVTPSVHSRNVRFVSPDTTGRASGKLLRKTPKTPASRKADLSEWLKAKGRTPSKFRHLMCFHGDQNHETTSVTSDPLTKTALTVGELSTQMDVMETERLNSEAQDQLTSMLDECTILYEAGCPAESIVPWLDDIYRNIPSAKESAQYYTCKANVIKSTLDLDAVLEVFEEATINAAQPKEDIAKCLTETIKYVTEGKVKQAKRRSRTPRRSLVQEENMFESSAVVYAVSSVAPFSDPKNTSRRHVDTPIKCRVVTPVRRSTRRSLQTLPESLKEKKDMYTSLQNMTEKDKEHMLFQPNLALDDLLAAAEDK